MNKSTTKSKHAIGGSYFYLTAGKTLTPTREWIGTDCSTVPKSTDCTF